VFVATAEDELRSHLDSGEKLLWAGRPAQGMVLTRQDWFAIPFSVVWLSFAIGIVTKAVYDFWQRSTPAQMPLALTVAVGLLFVGFGIYTLIGRFFIDRLYRSRLIYGVTDRRAIIVSGVRRRSVQSIYLSSLSALTLEERRDGSSTIYFGDQPSHWYGAHAGFSTQQGVGTQFFRIADAKQVYTIVREAMQRQKK